MLGMVAICDWNLSLPLESNELQNDVKGLPTIKVEVGLRRPSLWPEPTLLNHSLASPQSSREALCSLAKSVSQPLGRKQQHTSDV